MHFLCVLHSVPFEYSYVVNSSLFFFSPIDKQLQRYLGSLSKCMTGSLVQKMSSCLSRSRTIMAYEEQVITSQPTDMQKASMLMQIVIKKGQNACSSFLACLGIYDPVLYKNVTGFPGWTIYQKWTLFLKIAFYSLFLLITYFSISFFFFFYFMHFLSFSTI